MAENVTIEWRPVPTHTGYWASSSGDLRGPSGRVLRPMTAPSGHRYVLTPRPRQPRKLFVHRAVLLAFVGPPSRADHEGRHLDGNPSNNSLANLAWGSRLDNAADRQSHGRYTRGSAHVAARLDEAAVARIRQATGSARAVGDRFGVSHTTVIKIRHGERWAA